MAKKEIPLTSENLLRLRAATQAMIRSMQQDLVEEKEIKAFRELYSSLYLIGSSKTRENEIEFVLEVVDEDDEDEEESLELDQGEHDLRHK